VNGGAKNTHLRLRSKHIAPNPRIARAPELVTTKRATKKKRIVNYKKDWVKRFRWWSAMSKKPSNRATRCVVPSCLVPNALGAYSTLVALRIEVFDLQAPMLTHRVQASGYICGKYFLRNKHLPNGPLTHAGSHKHQILRKLLDDNGGP